MPKPNNTGRGECDIDGQCDPSKAVKKGRATWLCSKCGKDISLLYVMYVDAVRGMKDEKTVRGILTKPNAMTAKLEDSLASGHIVDAKTGESIKPNAKDAIQYAEDVKAGVQMSPAKPMTGVEEFDTHVFDPLIHTKDGKTWIEKGQARDFIRTLLTAERHLVRETMMGGQKAVLEQIFALINSDKSHVDRIEDVVNLLEKKLRSIEDTAWLA